MISLRLRYRLLRRAIADLVSGTRSMFADTADADTRLPFSYTLVQPIMPGTHLENKLHNIRCGASRIGQVIIGPKAIFSFWHLVGYPGPGSGYRIGRNIIAGKLSEDYGGGLCQLSSIIYHTSLVCGLTVLERHNHSMDIYREHERFTPLGADATVVYGYKDLRIRNDYPFPINYQLVVTETELRCTLRSGGVLPERQLRFRRREGNGVVHVATEETGGVVLAESEYQIQSSHNH